MKRLVLLLISLSLVLSQNVKADSEITIGGKTAQAHIIQSDGTSLRPRPYLNFLNGVECSDVNGKTQCQAGGSATFDSVELGSLQFDLTPTATAQEGLVYWNSDDGTLNVGMPGGNVNLQLGQETLIRCRNNSGVNILNGEAVYITGSQANRPTIAKAKGDVHSTSQVLGLATENIDDGSWGFVTDSGYVRDINASGGAEAWAAGDELYVSKTTAGALTNIEPQAPHHQDKVGEVINNDNTNGIVLVRRRAHRGIEDLADVDGATVDTTGQIMVWNNDSSYFDFDYSLADVSKRNGFENRTDSTISYDYSTQTITVEPTASTFNYFLEGVRHTIGSGVISKTHPDVTGTYYLYYDSSNTLTFSTTPFSILLDVPIAFVYYDASTPIGVAFDERHSAYRNPATHYELHNTIGAFWDANDGLGLSGYVVQPSSPADSDNQWDLATGQFHDEDISHSVQEVVGGVNDYIIAWRNGADGTWSWTTNNVPLLSAVGSYIYYNQYTGGSWGQTALDNNQYVNYYIIHMGSTTTTYRTVVIMSQSVHSTLANAQAESISNLSWGSFPNSEIISSYKVTFRTNAAYTTEGKCRIAALTDTRKTTGRLVVASTSTNHNSLGGLQGGTTGEYYHLDSSDYGYASTINWDDIATMTSLSTVNWDLLPLLQVDNINWDEVNETVLTAINWDYYATGGTATVNWDELPLIQYDDINWDAVDENVLTAINWDYYASSGSGISSVNWDELPLVQDYQINWDSIDELDITNINWDYYALSGIDNINWDAAPLWNDYTINWDSVDELDITNINWDYYALSGIDSVNWDAAPLWNDYTINWESIDELDITNINWDYYALSGIMAVNWDELPIIQTDGINWNSVVNSEIQYTGINWENIDNTVITGINWDSFMDAPNALTVNVVPKAADYNSLVNSTIFESEGNVGIGTSSPDSILEVVGGSDMDIQLNSTPSSSGLDSYVSLLLHCDGLDGAQTFTDSSFNPKTVGAVGNTYTETDTYKFETASAYLDGSGDAISINASAENVFGSNDFTLDFWWRPSNLTTGTSQTFWANIDGSQLMRFRVNDDEKLQIIAFNSGGSEIARYTTTSAVGFALNTWSHVAFVRDGSTFYIFHNGVSQAVTITTALGTGSFGDSASVGRWIGYTGDAGTTHYLYGYVDEFRVSPGIARWTDNFDPFTAEYDVATSSSYITFEGNDTAKWTVGLDGTDSEKFKIGTTGLTTSTQLEIDSTSGPELPDAINLTVGTTTGTKIGTGTTQKLGFWNATPVVQQTTSVTEAVFVESTGDTVNDNSTFDGYTLRQVIKALRNTGILQ